MKSFIIPVTVIALLATSCVSKKKYVALESQHTQTKGTLQKTTLEKDKLKAKFEKIESRVASYNEKINSLESDNVTLEKENEVKLDKVGNVAVISNKTREKMRATLAKVDPSVLAEAKTLKDSLNLAISYNLKNKINSDDLGTSGDIDINIDQTVVMISISDKLLFNTASYRVKKGAYKLITKLADIIKSEPSIDVMIEGHTDSRTINNAVVQDNWDLSVKRATSIVKILTNNKGLNALNITAAGKGPFSPLVENNSPENRAMNRRIEIILSPNMDALMNLLE